MNYKTIENYLLGKQGAKKDYPFGPDAAVFKVAEKMFALVIESESMLRINLKCDPGEAQDLRSMFDAITPGYHMNKTHWNTIQIDGIVPGNLIFEMIDASYCLVIKGLKKSEREKINKSDCE